VNRRLRIVITRNNHMISQLHLNEKLGYAKLGSWVSLTHRRSHKQGRIYELGEEQTSEVYTVSCPTKHVGLEQFWA
jgi:hypothetical protein